MYIKKARELLQEYHPNEIGRLLGLTESEGKKIVREIYFEWGFNNPQDWQATRIEEEEKYFVIFNTQGDEWIDENGDFRCFSTKKDAIKHLHESLDRHLQKIAINTYS